MKTIPILLFLLILTACKSTDAAIGYVEESRYILVDTLALKQKMLLDAGNKGKMTLDKVEILKVLSVGERQETQYLLLASSLGKRLRIARSLHLIADRFYLEEDLKVKSTHDELFFASYFITNDCDEECFPYIAILDGRKTWVAKKTLVCSRDSQCKPETVLVE